MMTTHSIKEQQMKYVEEVLKLIQKRVDGADPVEIVLSAGEQLEAEVRNGNVESLENSQSTSLSTAFAVNDRRAGFSTNDLNRETVERMVSETAETVPFMDKDPFYRLPDKKDLGIANVELDEEDSAFKTLEIDDLVKEIRDLERLSLKQDASFISNGAYCSIAQYHRFYISSAGFAGSKRWTIFRKGVGLVVEDSDGKGHNTGRRQSGGYYSIATYFADLMKDEKIAREAAQKTLRKLGSQKPKTQKLPVIFNPDTARTILGSLESALSGHALFRDSSFLQNRLGEKIASDFVTVTDDPFLRRGLGSKLFDNEGFMAAPMPLIEDGVLKNYLLDSYSSAKLKMKNNGHKGGSTNMILRGGNLSEKELISKVDRGIYLTDLSGQGVNIVTGDFSRGGQGLLIENGQLTTPVSEFTINSNLKEMFLNILQIADNHDYRSSYITPSILIDEMSIAGS